MIGSCAAFVDLDTRVRGTVHFGDDSIAEIEGHGRVEFICKNSEHHRFEGVYFIPQLAANIVSVGHLDEDGYQVIIGGGALAIREPNGKLLARVKWGREQDVHVDDEIVRHGLFAVAGKSGDQTLPQATRTPQF
jgi:hypothetical protein